MDLNAMAETAWQIAEEKGHHESLAAMPLREATIIRLALIHTEVSEAIQCAKRHGVSKDTTRSACLSMHELAEELADVLIRVGDLAVELGIDLNYVVDMKMAKNRNRPKYFGTPQEHSAH